MSSAPAITTKLRLDQAVTPRADSPSPCRVVELPPDAGAKWDAFVTAHPDGTLFHTMAWRAAVSAAFGHRAIYLTAVRNGRLVGVLPLFLIPSRIAGRMLVSVPYGVGGGIVARDAEAVSALFDRAKETAAQLVCHTIDLRSERAIVPELSTVEGHVGFRRELPATVEEVLDWLPRKARAAARNARDKYGLTVSFDDSQLKTVWRLYAISMRRLGSLAYPFAMFERLIADTPGRHLVSLVRREGRPIAGLVTFLFRDTVMPYFAGMARDARRYSAANYVYLTVMQRGVELGQRVFDFGRSRRDNTGAYNFKRFNGFDPRPLAYQRYTTPGHAAPDLSPNSPRFRIARRVWTHLPVWMTRAIGARLARHIPG